MNYLEVYFNSILKFNLAMNSDVISIGRASSNDVIIDNMGVSNHHAVISKKDTLFYLEDLNSTNGTFLNNQKITGSTRINSQDSITIGKHTIKFSEWSQSSAAASSDTATETTDATMLASKRAVDKNTSPKNPQQTSFHLQIKGEKTGINKLLLTKSIYTIGKAKNNEIRLGGWFTAAHIAEIEKIGQSFYLNPLKRNAVKLNNSKLNSSTLLTTYDQIKIKNLTLLFLPDQ